MLFSSALLNLAIMVKYLIRVAPPGEPEELKALIRRRNARAGPSSDAPSPVVQGCAP